MWHSMSHSMFSSLPISMRYPHEEGSWVIENAYWTWSYFFCRFRSWTFVYDEFMASLVNYASTNLALITLFTKAPNELVAMRTKNRLAEIGSHKFVSFDLMHISFHCATTLDETIVFFCKFPNRLFLFFFACPFHLNFDVNLAIRLQWNLKTMKIISTI